MFLPVLPNRIKSRCKQLDLSQEEPASHVGTSQGQIASYERGENEATGHVLIALARTLNTSSDWLLGLSEHSSVNLLKSDLFNDERAAITACHRGEIIEAVKIIVNG